MSRWSFEIASRRECIGAVVLLSAAACSSTKHLGEAQLLDPNTCGACHVQHFGDWTASMHAFASDDPVFRAMNARGQRETGGQLGTFCVNCHAPMAVRQGATTDGLNLDSLPQSLHGVTCFFCHSVQEVDGGNDDPLILANDLVMRGELTDAIPNTAHASAYSPFLDEMQPQSATACGACHDIVTGHGASIERTFQEWQGSVFAASPSGFLACASCHMVQSPFSTPIAQFPNAPNRFVHAHGFPGVDLMLPVHQAADGGAADGGQLTLVQALLGDTLQSALCFEPASSDILVTLDNVGAGHDWPSGATQDRRAWVEVVAWIDGGIAYSNGLFPPASDVTKPPDSGIWLLRDCMFDDAGTQVDMFWQAASTEGNELPALTTFNQNSPAFFQTHVQQRYDAISGLQGLTPDRITARVLLQPVGIDVLEDLVDSGDLDAGYVGEMPTLVVQEMEWTPVDLASSTCPDPAVMPGGTITPCKFEDPTLFTPGFCASTVVNVNAMPVVASHNARCLP